MEQPKPDEEPKKPTIDDVVNAIEDLLQTRKDEKWIVPPEVTQVMLDLKAAVEDLKNVVKEISVTISAGPRARAPVIEWDKAGIGPDVMALLEISMGPDGKRTVRAKKYMGDDWAKVNHYLMAIGFKWKSEGKKSHWREK